MLYTFREIINVLNIFLSQVLNQSIVLVTHRGDLSILLLPGINSLGLQSLQHFMQRTKLRKTKIQQT